MNHKLLLGSIVIAGLTGCQDRRSAGEIKSKEKPNIILILADDLGYGDLGCYGQKRFTTPNIDRLASEGMKFTQYYAGSTVCAPSRSALLTGLHTGHTPIRGNKEWQPEGQWPLPAESITLAEILKKTGYVTGAFGKWGLGYPGSSGDPNGQGFDEFFGYNCQRLAHNYYPYYLWHNHEKIYLEGNYGRDTGKYAPLLIHQKAMEFLRKHKDTTFFLYYPTTIPHAELFAPGKYISRYRNKLLPEKSFRGVDLGEGYRNGAYGSQPESHAAFAAMITLLDEQVGELMAALELLGIEKNTIIIFSSDNGPHLEGGADPDYFNSNGGLRGYKRDLYEGGIRTPFIVRWPGVVSPGTVSGHISAFWDLLPTLAAITKTEIPGPTDGISLLPVLTGKGHMPQHEFLFWEFHEQEGGMAVRLGNWKAVKRDIDKNPAGKTELYDLGSDPGERNDLAQKYPDIIRKTEEIMAKAHTPSEIFPFHTETVSK
jgi:arylsulfatase A-like enzyme